MFTSRITIYFLLRVIPNSINYLRILKLETMMMTCSLFVTSDKDITFYHSSKLYH